MDRRVAKQAIRRLQQAMGPKPTTTPPPPRAPQQETKPAPETSKAPIGPDRPRTPAPVGQAIEPVEITVGAVLIEPRDPLLLRDARPFSSDPGARAFTLPWPMPRTIAKSIRSMIGDHAFGVGAWPANAEAQRRQMAGMAVHGPLMVAKWQEGDPWEVYVPAPRDVAFLEVPGKDKAIQHMALRPEPCAPGEGISPVPESATSCAAQGYINATKHRGPTVPLTISHDEKPAKQLPTWWSLDDAVTWLSHGGTDRAALPITTRGDGAMGVRGIGDPPIDSRTHVSIRPDTLTHEEGALFTTESRAFPGGHLDEQLASSPRVPSPAQMAMLVKLSQAPAPLALPGVAPIGGERRLSVLKAGTAENEAWPPIRPMPPGWKASTGLRLQLVTPAIFTYGWLPEWLGNGTIPGLKGEKLQVELVSAAIDRRVPVSGWNRDDTGGTPAATEYAVPAGGVYFFRVNGGALTEAIWNKLWLAPISDLYVNRQQGFGLVLPGIWDAAAFSNLDAPAERPEEEPV